MNNIPLVKLGNVSEKIDYGLTTSAREIKGNPKFLRITDIQDNNVNWDSVPSCDCSEKDYKRYSLTQGDIVFARTGATTGKSFLIKKCPEKSVFTSYLIRVRPSPQLIPEYLSYFFQTPNYWRQISLSSTGTAQAGVNSTKLKELEIPLPPIAEQKRIAAILDKADAIRRKRQEAIKLTEELGRSLFLDMFGDPVTNPKCWPMVTVGDLVTEVKDGPHVSPKYSDQGVPILSTRNIRPSELLLDDFKYVSQSVYADLTKRFKPQYGDVLLTKGGTTGFAKVVDWEWDFAIWVHLACLRPNEKVLPEFLEAALNSPNCYSQSQKYTHGIANRDLGLKRIVKIKLSLPPIDLQKKYCEIRKKIVNQISKNEGALKESENLFNSLLQRAFKGEL